jgi:anti-sigma factor RsiW
MSSKQNNQPAIHLGNYEEFFLLYIDGELNDAQMQSVEDFVNEHPDLRSELDLLNGTKLSPETFSFPKEELLSQHMQQSVIGEELFLYMDNELSEDRKAQVEKDLANRPAYRLQLDSLLQTRLDASHTISYPDKKELYRREERRVAAFPWMRVAAAVLLLASGAVFYFSQSSKPATITGTASLPPVVKPKQVSTPAVKNAQEEAQTGLVAENVATPETKHTETEIKKKGMGEEILAKKNTLARKNILSKPDIYNPAPDRGNDRILTHVSGIINEGMAQAPVRAIEPNKVVVSTINNSPVTSALHNRNTMEDALANSAPASNEHKGSVKGFLRKATRLIEKRTGIDPTNDGELLIGVVAVQLK